MPRLLAAAGIRAYVFNLVLDQFTWFWFHAAALRMPRQLAAWCAAAVHFPQKIKNERENLYDPDAIASARPGTNSAPTGTVKLEPLKASSIGSALPPSTSARKISTIA
jgi:hypothetical protein